MTDEFNTRMQALLADTVARLDPADRAERIAYCEAHNEHGITIHLDDNDDVLEFRWGGRTLAMVHRDVLLDDGPIHVEFNTDVPDAPPDGME
jgi:hypothetical protein